MEQNTCMDWWFLLFYATKDLRSEIKYKWNYFKVGCLDVVPSWMLALYSHEIYSKLNYESSFMKNLGTEQGTIPSG